MYSRGLGRSLWSLEKMKCPDRGNRCYRNDPRRNMEEPSLGQSYADDTEQKSGTKHRLVHSFEAQEYWQPARTKAPDRWNDERIREQRKKPRLKTCRKCRTRGSHTDIPRREKVHQETHAKTGRTNQD